MNKYIIITGGSSANKGAQAMLYITVDEMKRRYPNKEIVLLSDAESQKKDAFKDTLNYKIMSINLSSVLYLMGGVYKKIWCFKSDKNKIAKTSKLASELKDIFTQTELMIDISGYQLSSQWSAWASIEYLLKIKLAKKFSINVYLMPQSFGPFDYKLPYKQIIDILIKRVLKYPQKIYAREKEGYELLTNQYKLKNVEIIKDMVLSSRELNIENVYKIMPKISSVNLNQAVGIIPNMRNFDHGSEKKIIELYQKMIEHILLREEKVYLLRHSEEDIKACRLVKSKFQNNERVIVVGENLSCIEFEETVKTFKFIIASRYHSIIHAYKNGVPCIAIGWATKYRELLEYFNQDGYIFDVRNNIHPDEILKSIDYMITNYKDESKTIMTKMKPLREKSIFDIIQ